MATVEIKPATSDHIGEITHMIRPEDRAELWAGAFLPPDQAMQMGIERGNAFTGFADGEAVVMWGVVQDSLMLKSGTPWLIASKKLEQVGITFLRRCKKQLMEMLKEYGTLENYVDARNTRAIEWLKWLGFTIGEPEPYGILGLPFHRFVMEI